MAFESRHRLRDAIVSLDSQPKLKLIASTLFAFSILSFAQTSTSPKTFTKDEVIRLLQGSVSPQRVETLVRQRGIDFRVTPTIEAELHDSGSTDELIAVLREIAPKPPLLVVTTKPPGAQVIIDDAPAEETNAYDGWLTISNLEAGQHKLRFALQGYQEREESVTLANGETKNVSVLLERIVPARGEKAGASAGKSPHSPGPPATLTLRGELTHTALREAAVGKWKDSGTLTLSNGRLQFKAARDANHSFSLDMVNVLPFDQEGARVTFDVHIPKHDKERYWFSVQPDSKSSDPSEAARQLFAALKAASR